MNDTVRCFAYIIRIFFSICMTGREARHQAGNDLSSRCSYGHQGAGKFSHVAGGELAPTSANQRRPHQLHALLPGPGTGPREELLEKEAVPRTHLLRGRRPEERRGVRVLGDGLHQGWRGAEHPRGVRNCFTER